MIVAALLTAILYVIQRLPVEKRLVSIVGLGVVSYVASMWSLRKDLSGISWLTDLLLPTLYPVSVALFYFLLPQQPVTRIVVLGVFALSMYALLLTVNIFAVATNRTIQLLRAARTVGFLLSIVTAALLYHVVFSLQMSFWIVTILSGLIALPVFVQGMWTYTLSSRMQEGEWVYVGVGTALLIEMALALTFWSIEPLMASVMLSMLIYVLLGIFQHDLDKRLFRKTIQEYLGFAVIVFGIVSAVVLMRWLA